MVNWFLENFTGILVCVFGGVFTWVITKLDFKKLFFYFKKNWRENSWN